MHVAELNSREIKRIHNLGSKNFFKKPQLISNTGYYTAFNQDYSDALVFILGNEIIYKQFIITLNMSWMEKKPVA